MIINKIQLVKYKRLSLNQINELILTPVEMVQLILGTNGCGKSSLVRELSPLPANASDFYEGGFKQIWLTNNGNSYVLKSGPGIPYSFRKNDEPELNKGMTVTVFKELIRQEFGITQEIHDLLTGSETFHSMSAPRRREWFIKLSDTNFEYALEIYNKFKERSRDITGALKLAKKRLVVESAKVISLEEETKLRKEVELTLNELNLLIEQSAPLDKPVSEYETEQKQQLDTLCALSNKLLRLKATAPYGTYVYGVDENGSIRLDDCGEEIRHTFSSVIEIESFIKDLNDKAFHYGVFNSEYVSKYNEIKETIDILLKTGNEGIKQLQERIVNLNNNKCSLLSKRKFNFVFNDPTVALSSIDSVYENLLTTFLAIPENEDKRFSQVKLNEYTDKLNFYKNSKTQLISELNKLQANKAHLESHKTSGGVICPKCHHAWIVGYSDEKFDELLNIIKEKEESISVVDKQITDAEASITAIYEYFTLYRSFTSCVKNWPILAPLWDYLISNNYVINSPREGISIIDNLKIDLEYSISAFAISKEIVELEELVKSAEKVGDANLHEQQERLKFYGNKISELTAEIATIKNEANEYTKYKNQLIEAVELGNKIEFLIKNAEKTNKDMIEMVRRETITHCIRQLQQSLALKENTLASINLQKGIINDLQNQIGILTDETEAIDILLKHLSPTTGIIAEGLLGFIKSFISQMNALVKKIWTYPLIIKDCNVSDSENSDLDYKFPMIVGNKHNVVPDVKFGSSGMVEIINIAFKITAMKYLGLPDCPLYLDEYSSKFDNAHKTTAILAIKSLMETSPIAQLFMVSHNYSEYGCFNNLEVCVIDPRNITTPAIYNEHVIIN